MRFFVFGLLLALVLFLASGGRLLFLPLFFVLPLGGLLGHRQRHGRYWARPGGRWQRGNREELPLRQHEVRPAHGPGLRRLSPLHLQAAAQPGVALRRPHRVATLAKAALAAAFIARELGIARQDALSSNQLRPLLVKLDNLDARIKGLIPGLKSGVASPGAIGGASSLTNALDAQSSGMGVAGVPAPPRNAYRGVCRGSGKRRGRDSNPR